MRSYDRRETDLDLKNRRRIARERERRGTEEKKDRRTEKGQHDEKRDEIRRCDVARMRAPKCVAVESCRNSKNAIAGDTTVFSLTKSTRDKGKNRSSKDVRAKGDDEARKRRKLRADRETSSRLWRRSGTVA